MFIQRQFIPEQFVIGYHSLQSLRSKFVYGNFTNLLLFFLNQILSIDKN